MKKELNSQQPTRPTISVNKELNKLNYQMSQQKLDKLEEIAKRAPLPDLHRRSK